MENWIEIYQTGTILFLIILMFIAGAVFISQVNILRNESSMHKRLQIRHKRGMEQVFKPEHQSFNFIEKNVIEPIILTFDCSRPLTHNIEAASSVSDLKIRHLAEKDSLRRFVLSDGFMKAISENSEVISVDLSEQNFFPIMKTRIRLGIFPLEYISKVKK